MLSKTADPIEGSLKAEDLETVYKTAKKFKFETEVNKLMKLIINSLYKTKGNQVWGPCNCSYVFSPKKSTFVN